MPHFEIVPHPVFTPTRCVTCSTNKDDHGFVDLLVDAATLGYDEHGDPIDDPAGEVPTIGHLYMCCTCLFQAAIKAGCLDPAQKAALEQRLSDTREACATLGQQLEAERENKVVSLDTVRELLAPAKKAAAS